MGVTILHCIAYCIHILQMMEQGPLALAIEQGDLEQDDEDAEDDEVKASDSMVVTAITEGKSPIFQ